MGASILPVTIIKGKVCFLFGKERECDETPGWSDFGGGTDGKETFLSTAIREGGEELTGFLGSSDDIRSMLKNGVYEIDFKSDGHDVYRCHIFPMVYDPYLEFYYNNNQKFLQKRLPHKIIRDSKIFEKTQIKWFSFDELKKSKKEFRSFYQNIVDLILVNKLKIESFVKQNKLFKKNNRKITKKNTLLNPKTRVSSIYKNKSRKSKSHKSKSHKSKSHKNKSRKSKLLII